MLCAALVFVTLFRQLKLGATLGYIVAGALIGPHLLGLIGDPEQRLVEDHIAGRRDYSQPLWSLMMFEAFLRKVHAAGPDHEVQRAQPAPQMAPVA